MRIRRVLLGAASTLAAAAALAGPAAAADQPKIGIAVSLSSQDEYFARYSVITDASTQYEHTRAEWVVTYTCDDSRSGVRGIADTAGGTKTRYFVNQPTTILVPLGSLCSIFSTWLVGGGGCSTCDGTGQSTPVTFAVPPGQPRRRYDPVEKAKAQRLRDSARRLAAKYTAASCPSGGPGCALAALYGAIAAYEDRIVNDPPDLRFRRRVVLSRPVPHHYTPAEAGTAATALNAFAAAGSDVLAAGRALNEAVERAQAALKAKQGRHERIQLRDAAGFAKRLATALDALTARATAAASAVTGAKAPAFAAAIGPPEWTAARAQVLAGGLPPALLAELHRLKVPPALVADTRGALATVTAVPGGDLGAALADPEQLAAQRSMAAMLRHWAAAQLRH